jgi:hypothetical protein
MREAIRTEIDVDAIEMNLSADDEGAQQTQGSFFTFRDDGPNDVGRGRERAFDGGGAAAIGRQRRSDSVGIGEKGLEARDDQALEFGCRQALPCVGIAIIP